MEIIILIIWGLLGGLTHYKFYQVAKFEGLSDQIDAFGIFLMYLLAPYWVLRVIFNKVIVEEWS